MKRVILESPFAANISEGILENVKYARRCVRDCLMRGEAPIASHLLYTQEGILDDSIPSERELGIAAGHAWLPAAIASVVYLDRGLSEGMKLGIRSAKSSGIPILYRFLGHWEDADRTGWSDDKDGFNFLNIMYPPRKSSLAKRSP
jgi:hypothetical protein